MSALQQLLAGIGASGPLDVADVFSATTYAGTGSAQTITTGVNLEAYTGMLWRRERSNFYSFGTLVYDTLVRNRTMFTHTNDGRVNTGTSLTPVSDGFYVITNIRDNNSGSTYISYSFRSAPKFFDIVAYTGGGSMADVINHSLGVTPGVIIAKRTNAAGSWGVNYLVGDIGSGGFIGYSLESTSAQSDTSNSTSGRVTSTTFQPGYLASATFSSGDLNISGAAYIAYLFADDASADGLIRCGKYTGNGSATGPSVTLGWEPQFLLVKNSTGTGDWAMYDSARDATNPRTAVLLANSSAAESTTGPDIDFTATGFQVKSTATNVNTSGSNYIYIAIRKP